MPPQFLDRHEKGEANAFFAAASEALHIFEGSDERGKVYPMSQEGTGSRVLKTVGEEDAPVTAQPAAGILEKN